VAFSPDGKRLAGAGGGYGQYGQPLAGVIKVWDAATGEEVLTLKGHEGGVNGLAFSPDGHRLASASGDRTVRLWNAQTGKEQLRLSGHTHHVLCVAFSPDGSHLASGSADKTVRVWDAASGEAWVLGKHGAEVWSVSFSADGGRLATADDTVRVWDMRAAPDYRTFSYSTGSMWPAAALSADGRRVAITYQQMGGHFAAVCDPATGRVLAPGYLGERPGIQGFGRESVTFSADGRRLVSSQNGRVRCWDLETGKEVFTVRGGGVSGCFSPDGRRFAGYMQSPDLRACDASTGQEVLTLKDTGGAHSVAFSGDGSRLASMVGRAKVGFGPEVIPQEVKVWDLASGQAIQSLRAPDFSRPAGSSGGLLQYRYPYGPSVALSPDGRWVAASGDYVQVWDAVTGQGQQVLRGHDGPVYALAFSTDGRRLASGGGDGTVRLWDVATGSEVLSFHGPAQPVICLGFSLDGRHLVSLSRQPVQNVTATVRVWDTEEPSPEVRVAAQRAREGSPPFAVPGGLDDNKLREVLGGEALDRPGKLRAALDKARGHAGQGKWPEAAAAYAEAVQGDPQAAQAAYEHIAALLLAGDRDAGRRAGAQALERFANTANPWAACSVARLALLGPDAGADPAQLVRLAEQAAAAHPGSGLRLQTLAAAHYRAGRYGQALRTLQEAEKADWFGYPTVINWLLRALVHQRLGQTEEARKWLDKAVTWLDQATQTTPKEQAEALHLELPDLMACRLLRREAQLPITGKVDDPPSVQNETAWFLATAADAKLWDPARAVELARKAVERAPREGVYWKTLGVAQYRAGDWKAAVSSLDKAQALAAGDGAAKLFLAMAHWQSGGREQARQWYDSAVPPQAEARPQDEDYRRFRDEAHVLLDLPRLTLVRRIEWTGAHVYHTCFSPDGRSYLAGGDVGQLRLWDVETGKQLQEFKGHDGWTSQATFTPDGKQVLSGGTQDKSLRLWDVTTGRQVRTFTGHTAEVLSVAVSPDGRFALSGGADKTLRLWELATGKEVPRGMTGYADRGIFSPDGLHVLSFGADQTLRLWEAGTGKLVRTLAGHTGPVAGAWFLPGGRQVVSYAADNTLRVWEVESGKEVRRLGLPADHCAIRWLALTPDGRGFLTNHQDLTVRWHDLATGREWHRLTLPSGATPQGLSVSPDGRHAADGSWRGFVYLFRLAGGEGAQSEKPAK
jgi:WD40 repeat protein